MASALSLIPAAPRVFVDIAVCRRILGSVCGLSRGSIIAVRARRGDPFATRRSLYRAHRPLGGGLVLGIGGVAVLGDDRTSVAPIGIGGLMRRSIGPGVWVVSLANFLGAVSSRGRCAASICSSGRIVGSPSPCDSIRAVGGGARTVVAAVPCTVPVVGVASVYDRAAVPIAVPVAVTPPATTVVYRCPYGDANSECDRSGGHHGCSTVPGSGIGIAVNYRRVINGDIHHLRISRLNHDGLRRLLHNDNLRSRLQVPGSQCLCS